MSTLRLADIDQSELESSYSFRDLQRVWKHENGTLIRSKSELVDAIRNYLKRNESTTHNKKYNAKKKDDMEKETASPSASSNSKSKKTDIPLRRTQRNNVSYPSSLNEASTEKELHVKSKTDMESTANCFDFGMYMPEKIQSYLEEDATDNIVVLGHLDDLESSYDLKQAVCYTRSRLRMMSTDENTLFYPCFSGSQTLTTNVNMSSPFVKLAMVDFNVFVSKVDVLAACERADRNIFQIQPSAVNFKYTASSYYVGTGQRVSTDHCQLGTSKQIYLLRPVKLNFAENTKKQTAGEETKKKQTAGEETKKKQTAGAGNKEETNCR